MFNNKAKFLKYPKENKNHCFIVQDMVINEINEILNQNPQSQKLSVDIVYNT